MSTTKTSHHIYPLCIYSELCAARTTALVFKERDLETPSIKKLMQKLQRDLVTSLIESFLNVPVKDLEHHLNGIEEFGGETARFEVLDYIHNIPAEMLNEISTVGGA